MKLGKRKNVSSILEDLKKAKAGTMINMKQKVWVIKYTVRIVGRGFEQKKGIDYTEVFALVT